MGWLLVVLALATPFAAMFGAIALSRRHNEQYWSGRK